MQDLLYKLDKTTEDVNELLKQNKNLVYDMLSKYGQLHNSEAESAAWEGLWDAINTFDVFATTAFSTYACTLIKHRIGDVLRKQNAHCRHYTQYFADMDDARNTVITDISYTTLEDRQFINKFQELFELYISRKSGVTKSILAVWYSTGFNSSVTNLSAACGCSASFVCRVQCDFRAYLSSKLKAE